MCVFLWPDWKSSAYSTLQTDNHSSLKLSYRASYNNHHNDAVREYLCITASTSLFHIYCQYLFVFSKFSMVREGHLIDHQAFQEWKVDSFGKSNLAKRSHIINGKLHSLFLCCPTFVFSVDLLIYVGLLKAIFFLEPFAFLPQCLWAFMCVMCVKLTG